MGTSHRQHGHGARSGRRGLSGALRGLVLAGPVVAASLAATWSPPAAAAAAPAPSALLREVAAEVNLVPADLPGWDHNAGHVGAAGPALLKELQCAGAVPPARSGVMAVPSPAFGSVSNYEQVGSLVEMVSTTAYARQDLHAQQGPRMPACAQQALEAELHAHLPGNYRLSSVKVDRMALPWLPAAISFAYRESVTIRAKQSATFTEDAISFVLGRAEVNLYVEALEGTPGAHLEQRLGLLLLHRAEAHRAQLS